ncbi:MAG: hypothetical protein JNM84_04750 [Planctomycetes bacterium]|nr:hypothetical protein [Planctomycetota bacterium]
MPRSSVALSIATLCLFGFGAEQGFAQSAEEVKFRKQQADKLHDYAEQAFKKGFPMNARRVWLMLLSEYDPDHEGARKALGYTKVGKAWGLDPKFSYPKNDDPDAAAAKALRASWEKTAKSIADAHKKQAEQYDKAGRTDLSKQHFEKVLFFQPGDKDAQAALQHKPVEGVTGTDLEVVLYDRSKKIERAVAEQSRKDYPVEEQPDTERNPLLDRAKVAYKSVKSEHFTVRGDFEVELLKAAALNAERAIRVMEAATEGTEGFSRDPQRWLSDWAFFKDKDTYKQILQANADLMSAEDLKFRLENSSASAFGSRESAIRVSAAGNEQGILDGAVRNVAQTYAGVQSDALREGIGHTIVGMFFNNNRQFVVDRKEQERTSSTEEDLEKFSPNFDAWKDLALEAAWKLADTASTSAAQLPIIQAAKFPDDARIKSWSFVDYLMRRDPKLLLSLDSFHQERSPISVEKKFAEANEGLTLAQLEKEWKDFWTEASPVLKAIRNNTEPLASVSKDVQKWLEEFNKARTALDSTTVTWSSAYSTRCKDHVEYLLANEAERGPVAEQDEKIDLPLGSHLGSMFAQMALVAIDPKKPKELFEAWLDYPGYRDALLNNGLKTIGLYSDKNILVFDAIRGVGQPPKDKGGYRVFPLSQRQAVPNQVNVEDLGPELKTLLEKHGHGDKKVIGYPLTLHHFGTGGIGGRRDSYRCQVQVLGKAVEGIVHVADGGSNRRTSAPGLVVFYPLEPLKKGSQVDAVWTFEHDQGSSRTAVTFFTK